MKNLYAFLAFSYVSSSRTRNVLSFTTAYSTCGCAIFILVDLCPIHHSKLYAKGATFICAFERSLAICIPHRPITFPLSYGTFFPLPSVSQRPCYTQLIHRYHMGALTLLGLGPFPTNLGETFVAFSAHCCLESRCPHLHPSHYNIIIRDLY